MTPSRATSRWAPLAALLLPIAVAVPSTTGCRSAPAATNAVAPTPEGEVWLTTQQVRDAKVQVEPVAEHGVGNEIVTSGKVSFDDLRVAHIFSPVTGRIKRIVADPGQRVKKGAALAIIESPDVGNAFADYGKAQADLVASEHDFRRQKELFDAHAGSQRDFESAEDSYGKARAEMDRAKQKARLFRNSSTDAVSQEFTLRAPIEGEVIARNVNPGAEVQGQYSGGTAVELFTVGELDAVWVFADVFEMDLARVKRGRVRQHQGRRLSRQGVRREGRLDLRRARSDLPHGARPLLDPQQEPRAQARDVRHRLHRGRGPLGGGAAARVAAADRRPDGGVRARPATRPTAASSSAAGSSPSTKRKGPTTCRSCAA